MKTLNRNIRTFATLALFALLVAAAPAFAADGVVNVNTADEDQLALLPRVGPAIAGRIAEHRDANGEFAGTEELMLVRGIGEKTFELIPSYSPPGNRKPTDSHVSARLLGS